MWLSRKLSLSLQGGCKGSCVVAYHTQPVLWQFGPVTNYTQTTKFPLFLILLLPIQEVRVQKIYRQHGLLSYFKRKLLDPSVLGQYPRELVDILEKHGLRPKTTEEELTIIKENRVDFLGVNYYQPLRVQAPSEDGWNEEATFLSQYFQPYDKPDKKINPHRGWEIYEEGLYDIAKISGKLWEYRMVGN